MKIDASKPDQLNIAELPELPPVIRAYRLVACYAEVLLGVCMEADKKEELGNVDGSHLDDLANALGHLADVERDGLDALAAQAPLIERIKELENALTEVRHFFEAERKTISKGNGSQWAKWQCEEQMEAIDAVLATNQGGQQNG